MAFENYPSFFLAHEIAHQWWGQAVGWKNYHEQWLSEGFAQYFAALYAERERGADQFASVIRQMRRWAIDMSPQGPVYLGYRLGHIKGDTRVFRAVVYNKGAMVLHMLRRLVGDRAFFAGLREFYTTERFKKAGTDDFQAAMEAASGKSLQRFFDRWIFESDIPTVRFSVPETTSSEVRVRFEQMEDRLFDIPITVTVSVRGRIVGGRDGCRHRQGHRAQHPSEASAALGRREPGRGGARGDSQIDPGPDPDAGCGIRCERIPRIALGQVNRRDAWIAVALERLVHDDEPEAGVLVEAGQPLAEGAAIDFLAAAFRGAAETGGHSGRRVADADLLPIAETAAQEPRRRRLERPTALPPQPYARRARRDESSARSTHR